MTEHDKIICVPSFCPKATVIKVKTRRRQSVTPSTVVCIIKPVSSNEITFNAPGYGQITMLCQEGAPISANEPIFKFQACQHHVVMRDLCAECGANLRKEGGFCGERIADASASIPMVHMIPELHVSESVAAEIALQDEKALLSSRKLVLLIDLDQTVLHTTIDGHAFRYKNIHRFRLPGCPLIYHTRFRPHLHKFLERISRRFQLHICTFGNRAYAHQLASILDPKRQYFCQRILSRDECFNPVTKSANLKALFPRGVHLVCIIDDRGDVWDWSPNLIHVQPYRFFPEVGDINGPPGRPLSLPPIPDFRPIPTELVTTPPSPSPHDSNTTSTSTASGSPASAAADSSAMAASRQAKETDMTAGYFGLFLLLLSLSLRVRHFVRIPLPSCIP
uniref:RNA polymerase II subunit A C-terminal domain phosphatase n=1 Tax=Schistocephalus solidus TaxID=70667 RepID=A0A0X3PBT4_SCHSO